MARSTRGSTTSPAATDARPDARARIFSAMVIPMARLLRDAWYGGPAAPVGWWHHVRACAGAQGVELTGGVRLVGGNELRCRRLPARPPRDGDGTIYIAASGCGAWVSYEHTTPKCAQNVPDILGRRASGVVVN